MRRRRIMQAKEIATAGSRRLIAAGKRAMTGDRDSSALIASSSEQVETVADLEQPCGTEAHREKKHGAPEQRLPQGLDVEEEQEIADGAEGERAEDCADGAAGSPEQRHAAEHHRGDRVERVGVAVGERGLARIGEE